MRSSLLGPLRRVSTRRSLRQVEELRRGTHGRLDRPAPVQYVGLARGVEWCVVLGVSMASHRPVRTWCFRSSVSRSGWFQFDDAHSQRLYGVVLGVVAGIFPAAKSTLCHADRIVGRCYAELVAGDRC